MPWATVFLLAVGYYHHSRSADDLAAIEAENVTQVKNSATILSRVLHRTRSDVLVLASGSLLADFVESGARVE